MGFSSPLSPPTLGGVLDGFSNGEGENPLLFSLTALEGGDGSLGSRSGSLGPKPLGARAPRPWRPWPQGPGGPGPKPSAPSPCKLVLPCCTIDFLPPQARRWTACVLVLTRSGKPGFLHRLICFKSHKYYPLARARFWCRSSSS